MNTAQWHLLLNHLPIMGTVFGTLILTGGYILGNNTTVKKTALGVFVISALLAIPSFLTGEGAEDVVENLPGVAKSYIETHEDLGKIFIFCVSAIGLLSIITFFSDWKKNKAAPFLYGIVLIAGIGTSVLAKQVGTSGGEVRHTEIRSGTAQQQNNQDTQGAGGEKDED